MKSAADESILLPDFAIICFYYSPISAYFLAHFRAFLEHSRAI